MVKFTILEFATAHDLQQYTGYLQVGQICLPGIASSVLLLL